MRLPEGLWALALVLLLLCISVSSGAAQLAPAEEQAAVLFERARDAYRQGEFERAEVLLREALSAADVPALHYNLARTLHELGRWREAIDEYEAFLGGSPDSPEAPRVRARVALLEERIAEQERLGEQHRAESEASIATVAASAAMPDLANPASGPGEQPSGASPWPWIVAGIGVAAVGGGVGFGLASQASVDEARSAPNQVAAEEHRRQAAVQARASNALSIAGGVVAVAALIWGIVDAVASRGAAHGVTDAHAVADDGRGVVVRF